MSIKSIRGMNDLLPTDSAAWQAIEATIIDVLTRYGIQEIRFPIVEKTELFKRSIGEVTDIVEKEMYTFSDRSDESITLRPEGTASCVRACLQHSLLDRPQRLWYTGPMFRYERPQKGRLRQFHQFGVEIFGLQGPDIDAELLIMTARLWRELGISDAVSLEINSLGTPASRAEHKAALLDYLESHKHELDEDSLRRLSTNPLRILDSKNPNTQLIVEKAPKLTDYLDAESKAHFESVQALLDAAGVTYRVNPNLVRGLDYYSRTVFEWVTDKLGAQGTVCGGGRYDALVEQLGGKPTPALGFGMGIERLILLLETLNAPLSSTQQQQDVYIVVSAGNETAAMLLAEKVRDARPDMSVLLHSGGGSFKSQFKKADRSGADYALVIGDDEAKNGGATLKFLREQQEQESLLETELLERLRSL